MKIAVYLGSTSGNDPAFEEYAERIGQMLARNGHTLVYGGADGGMMGKLAASVLKNGGHVIGGIPEFFMKRAFQGLDELITVKTMSERKQIMMDLSDGFIALPGGPGTVEEITEIISALRIGLFRKPCVIFSPNGYYDSLRMQYDQMLEEGFLSLEERCRFEFVETVSEVQKVLGI